MNIFKQTIYLLYYLKEADFKTLKKFNDYARKVTGRSKINLKFDVIKSVYKYNISLKDYYYFRFFEMSHKDRQQWAGTGFMYEYQLKMNPKTERHILEDKILFLKSYAAFIRRDFLTIDQIKDNQEQLEKLLNNSSGRVVLKNATGQVGAEVEVVNCIDLSKDSIVELMRQKNYNLIEEYVIQHSSVMELSPSGLNTLRVFTQLNNGLVDILGVRLRISVNSPVDNMAAGNIAAPVDLNTGKVNGPGVYSDITKKDEEIHPITQSRIIDFEIPYWNEIIELVKKAAIHDSSNTSIGWDVAIGSEGPELIEGNHNWCKLLWQLPVKKGLKNDLLKYF